METVKNYLKLLLNDWWRRRSIQHEGVSLSIRIARPSEVSLGKSSKGERDIKSVDDIGAPVQYEFRVRRRLLREKFPLIASFDFQLMGNLYCLCVFLTDSKFGQTIKVFHQRVTKHLLAKGELCRKMASVPDSEQQHRCSLCPLLTCRRGQSIYRFKGKKHLFLFCYSNCKQCL